MMKSFLCELLKLLNKEISNQLLPTKCYVDNKSLLVDSIFFKKNCNWQRIKNWYLYYSGHAQRKCSLFNRMV